MTERRFVLILLAASVLRTVFDITLMKVGFWGLFSDFFYIFAFYLSIVYSVYVFCTRVYKVAPSDTRQYFFGYAPYWLFLYPAVSVITYVTYSSYQITIPFFKYVPGFMVYNNYLPTGMVYIIPLMLFFFLVHAKQYYKLSVLQLFWPVVLIFTIDYLVIYQWMYGFGYYLRDVFSGNTFMAVYNIMLFAWGAPFVYFTYKECQLSKYWLVAGAAVIYSFVFLLGLTAFRYLFPF